MATFLKSFEFDFPPSYIFLKYFECRLQTKKKAKVHEHLTKLLQ